MLDIIDDIMLDIIEYAMLLSTLLPVNSGLAARMFCGFSNDDSMTRDEGAVATSAS